MLYAIQLSMTREMCFYFMHILDQKVTTAKEINAPHEKDISLYCEKGKTSFLTYDLRELPIRIVEEN